MKNLSLFLFLFLLSCSSESVYYNADGELCPVVQIIRNEAYLSQFVGYKEQFQISISGYDGYCYYDNVLQRHRAVIRPTFKIKRLSRSPETDVRFSYYTETVKGPTEYLGKKTHYITAHIRADELETYYTAPEVKVFIPEKMIKDYDVNLGLWISPNEAKYNQRTFDINYRYIDE
ncbi:MAG: hypothetical protein IJ660_04230 [Alphaproteobacteria bacterium]|nr:hypothetical protein [Alphaproteobacteria bacterium]